MQHIQFLPRHYGVFLLLLLFACSGLSDEQQYHQDQQLLAAVGEGREAAVKAALKAGAQARTADADGTPVLILATSRGYLPIVRLLLAKGADPNARRESPPASTALMEAAPKNDTLVAARLLAAGALSNLRDSLGETALHWAAYYGHISLSKLLLKHGADLQASGRNGTALDVAIARWHAPLAAFLVQRGAGEALAAPSALALCRAVQKGDAGAVEQLLAKGARPDQRDEAGTPVLVMAAQKGPTSVVATLLSQGADVNAFDRVGHTALAAAAHAGHETTIQSLLSAGADPNATDRRFRLSPLRCAAASGHAGAARLLLQAGAQVDAQDGLDGYTPLMLAAAYGHASVVRLLLDAKASPHIKGYNDVGLYDMISYSRQDEIRRMVEEHLVQGAPKK